MQLVLINVLIFRTLNFTR